MRDKQTTEQSLAPWGGWKWEHCADDDSWSLVASRRGEEVHAVAYDHGGGESWCVTVHMSVGRYGATGATFSDAIRAACPCPAIADALVRAWKRRSQ